MKKRINIFIANTPFQLYVIRIIISSFFSGENYNNIIFSTCPSEEFEGLYLIKRGISSIKDILRLKRFIKTNIGKNVQFFIPHLSNLLSNYCYNVAKHYKKPINVFYEGIAQFYHPDVKIKNKTLRNRKILSLFLGLGYEARTEFYPKELTDIATFYTPIPELCVDCNNKVLIQFPRKSMLENDNVLFLSTKKMDEQDTKDVVITIKQVSKVDTVIYFKPHYELPEASINNLIFQLNKEHINVVLLDKHRNIELYYEELLFAKVLSQEFSSALVNIKLIFQDQIKIKVMRKPFGLSEKLYSYFGFGNEL